MACQDSMISGNLNIYNKRELITDGFDTNRKFQVFLRLKPGLDKYFEVVNDNEIVCHYPSDCQAIKNLRSKDNVSKCFKFSKIFTQTYDQADIFSIVIKRRVQKFLDGMNNNIFAYGASGSGKTYTIMGDHFNPGIIPRAINQIFKKLPVLPLVPIVKLNEDSKSVSKLSPNDQFVEGNIFKTLMQHSTDQSEAITMFQSIQARISTEADISENEDPQNIYGVWISFAEIYNEQVHDLLVPATSTKRANLKIRTNHGKTYIKGLKHVYVSSAMQAFQLLQFGINQLNYAETSVNLKSSRSHCIFTVTLTRGTSESKLEDYKISRFNFCDLAGSERVKNTNNTGTRLREGNNINCSLSVLGRCIACLIDQESEVKRSRRIAPPYRDSKLTQIFQRELLGEEDIAMIVNVNPCKRVFDETLNVLGFAAMASKVVVQPPAPTRKLLKANRFSMMMHGDEIDDIEELKEELEEWKQKICDLAQEQEMIFVQSRQETMEYFKGRYTKILSDLRDQLLAARLELEDDEDDSVCIVISDDDDDDLEEQENRKELADLMEQNENLDIEIKRLSNTLLNSQKTLKDLEDLLADGNKLEEEKLRSLDEQRLELAELQQELQCIEEEKLQQQQFSSEKSSSSDATD